MKAIILAAGMSKRFGIYTAEKPKCMLELGGVPIIKHQIDLLRESGIDDIIIVKGYLEEKINFPDVRYYLNTEYQNTNMVESLFCARKEISGDVIISYADIIYNKSVLSEVLSAHDNKVSVVVDLKWKEYYTARFSDPYIDAESLVYDKDFRIQEIGASQPDPNRIQGQYIGLTRLNKEGAKVFQEQYNKIKEAFRGNPWIRGRNLEHAYMTDFLQSLIDSGVPIHAIPIENGWLEFDSINDYKKVLTWQKTGELSQHYGHGAFSG
jgi:choline kinase